MDYKARLYLDVDGVLNAEYPEFKFEDPEHPDTSREFMIRVKALNRQVNTYRMVFSPVVIRRLDELRERYNLELVWNSTWNENLEVLRLSKYFKGLDDGRVLHGVIDYKAQDEGAWSKWKADVILKDQRNDNLPFIWVDDVAVDYHGPTVDKAFPDVPKLLLNPYPVRGITAEHLDRMEEFLATL
jgi:hypothetical protein